MDLIQYFHEVKDQTIRMSKNENEKINVPALITALGWRVNTSSMKCYLDSGATSHMSTRSDWFSEYHKISAGLKISVASNQMIFSEKIVSVNNDMKIIQNVNYVPILPTNLL